MLRRAKAPGFTPTAEPRFQPRNERSVLFDRDDPFGIAGERVGEDAAAPELEDDVGRADPL